MWIIRKLFGLVIILVALAGIAMSVGCTLYSGDVIDDAVGQLSGGIDLVNLNLENTNEALVVAQDAIVETTDAIDNLSETAGNLSKTVSDTEPLLDQISNVSSQQIPEGLETVQKTLPNIAEVAGSVDDTLNALSGFGFDQELPFIGSINFDLGIDYDPNQRFDASIIELGNGLEGLPEDLRALETEFDTTKENLSAVSGNIETISDDLLEINAEVEEIPELLNTYISSINDVQSSLSQTKAQITDQVDLAKQAVFYLAIWFSLLQLAPLVYGFQLLFGRSQPRVVEVAAPSSSKIEKVESTPIEPMDPEVASDT